MRDDRHATAGETGCGRAVGLIGHDDDAGDPARSGERVHEGPARASPQPERRYA